MPPSGASLLTSAQFMREVRLARALTALSSLHPAARRRFRSLNYSGFFLCLSGMFSVWGVTQLGAGDVADVVALRILAYACWLYGGMGLWTLLAPDAFEGTGLAPLRGVSLPLSVPASFTIAQLVARGILQSGLIALALAALLSENAQVRTARLLQLVLCIPYVLIFAASLGLIGGLSLALVHRRARILALFIILGPFLLHLAGTPFPNLLSAMSWGLNQIIAVGAP